MFNDRWEVRLAKKAEISVSKAHKAHSHRKILGIRHLGHDMTWRTRSYLQTQMPQKLEIFNGRWEKIEKQLYKENQVSSFKNVKCRAEKLTWGWRPSPQVPAKVNPHTFWGRLTARFLAQCCAVNFFSIIKALCFIVKSEKARNFRRFRMPRGIFTYNVTLLAWIHQ